MLRILVEQEEVSVVDRVEYPGLRLILFSTENMFSDDMDWWRSGSQSRFRLRNEKEILSVYRDPDLGLHPAEYRNNNDITFQSSTNPQRRQK
jgi:hypothetical protein